MLPTEYIEQAQCQITRESFERRLREYRPATEALQLLTPSDTEYLFRETCDYLKELNGSRQMRSEGVPQDLKRCNRLPRPIGHLSKFFRSMERQCEGQKPFSSAYAQEVLDRTRALIEKINEEWADYLRHQGFLISKMMPKTSRQVFTQRIDAFLSRILRKKKRFQRRLGKKTRQHYQVALTTAIMAATGEPLNPEGQGNRTRQQLSNARKAPGLISELEVEDYIQVGKFYAKKPTKKKQSGKRRK